MPRTWFSLGSPHEQGTMLQQRSAKPQRWYTWSILFSSRLLWHFVGQKIQHHSCPAGISAPSASKYQRSEYFGYGIMYCCSLKHACEQIIPESLDLHIFVTYQPKIDKHVQTDKKLNNASCVLIFLIYKKHQVKWTDQCSWNWTDRTDCSLSAIR